MTMSDTILADLDRYIRAAKPAAKPQPARPAPPGAVPPPADEGQLEAVKQQILDAAHEALDWDGSGAGDPNDSVAALEEALGDMFDAHVEIMWDGESKLTMTVEDEEPVHLTLDYLGELLEALAMQGGDAEAPEPDGADDEDDGRLPTGQRGAVVDKQGHHHAASGENGGQFVSKTGAAGSAAKSVVKTAAKAAKASANAGGGGRAGGGSADGPKAATDLAKRAGGRAGPRATAKAVGETLSASTGNRVRVKGNKDGTFDVGPKKKKMSGKAVAAIVIVNWLAFGTAGGLVTAMTANPLLGFGVIGAGHLITAAILDRNEKRGDGQA